MFFQQFLAATSPVSFFIKIYSRDGTKGFQETHENRTTGEQLIVRSSSNWTIGRCPLGVDVTTWLKEMAEEMEAFGSFDLESKIELRKPLLGPMESGGEEGEESNADGRGVQQEEETELIAK